ncbi:MAG: fasciclin domain-containing protein [Mangrovibacterium sp.]
MKKLSINKIVSGIFILLICACADQKWDDYYNRPEFIKEGNSFEVLKKDPAYKEFVGLLKKTGSDSILQRSEVHTVLAPKNGSFNGIDTTSNTSALKKLIGMHIIPSVLYREGMVNANKSGISGKLLKFRGDSQGVLVNGVRISAFDLTSSNGVIHTVDAAIVPLSNLYEAVMSNPDLFAYKDFIASSYKKIIDPYNNIKIGYDTLNNPIYKEPVNYINYSDYLAKTGLRDENTLTTGLFPSNQLVDELISHILPSRGGYAELIAPRLGIDHGDTIVAWRYFKRGESYVGDTAAFLNDLFNYVIIRGAVPSIENTPLKNINGEEVSVAPAQVKTDPQVVSNGYYYVLDGLDVPQQYYRKEFFFIPSPKIEDPADPTKTINNPNIILNGTSSTLTVVSSAICYTKKFTRFDFTRVGASFDIRFPLVVKGAYNVELSYLPEDNHGIVDVSYNNEVLIRDLETSKTYNSRALLAVSKVLGTINVVNNGAVQIKFTLLEFEYEELW